MPRIEKAEALSLVTEEWERLPAIYDGCVMCAMADGYPDDLEILASNAQAIAVLDRFGTRRGHVLVVLRRHVESIADLPWNEYAAVQRLAWEASLAVDQVLRPTRVFVAALGSTAKLPNTFAHHHVHVIPLEPGGEDRPSRVFSWEPGVYVYSAEEGRELAATLRASWPRAGSD
ncbi:MAG: HIT family protein [Polyangiaceae bacterium]|nr:HIT family protein [Polyangiaceae bacterium]